MLLHFWQALFIPLYPSGISRLLKFRLEMYGLKEYVDIEVG